MTRNRGKKALYEVMSKARGKQSYGKSIESMRPKKIEERKPVTKPSKTIADWWKKPKIAQFIEGRLEFSVPYQAAIAISLVFVLLLLGSYRLGQNSIIPAMAVDKSIETPEKANPDSPKETQNATIERPGSTAKEAPNKETTLTDNVKTDAQEPVIKDPVIEEEVKPEKPKGNNVIVLVEFGRMADLVPVQQHFAEHGIETEINFRGNKYFLETVERYDNPATPGNEGFKAKVEIMRVGLLYKGMAPAGVESFEAHLFQDVYGRKVKE